MTMDKNFVPQQIGLREKNMTKEKAGEESIGKVSIGIVTEDVTILLPEILERYQIELVYAKYDWPPEKDLPGENIYQKMKEADKRGIKTFVKTSQPSPKAYLDAFKKQLERFDKVLCITISSKISGCYNSACQAKEMLSEKEKERIYILDSLNAAAGEALLVLKAIELIQGQREISEIIEKLRNLIPQTHLYLILEDPKWIAAIGRITKSQANWVRRMKKLRLHPIMEFKNGVIGKGGIVFAQSAEEAIFKKILKESKKLIKQGKRIRVVICHADNLEGAKELKKMVEEKMNAEVPFLNLAPSLIGAATGPGTLIIGWMPIE